MPQPHFKPKNKIHVVSTPEMKILDSAPSEISRIEHKKKRNEMRVNEEVE